MVDAGSHHTIPGGLQLKYQSLFLAIRVQWTVNKERSDATSGHLPPLGEWFVDRHFRENYLSTPATAAVNGPVHAAAPGSVLLANASSLPTINIDAQHQMLMAELLARLSARDREALRRFYVDEQTNEQICTEMGMLPEQLRMLKTQTKAKFAEAAQQQGMVSSLGCLHQVLGHSVGC